MDWLLLAVLGIIWAVVLLPGRKRDTSPAATAEGFGKDMDLLAEAEQEGRWVIMPQKGVPIGESHNRAAVLERRRKVLVFLLEGTAVSLLIGLLPPLRSMWIVASGFVVALVLYCWLLIRLRAIALYGHGAVGARPGSRHRIAQADDARYVADRYGRVARSSYGGLPTVTEGDVHVVVRSRD